MVMTTAKLRPWKLAPLSVSWLVSTDRPCLNNTMKARPRMNDTETASRPSMSSDQMRMSL